MVSLRESPLLLVCITLTLPFPFASIALRKAPAHVLINLSTFVDSAQERIKHPCSLRRRVVLSSLIRVNDILRPLLQRGPGPVAPLHFLARAGLDV